MLPEDLINQSKKNKRNQTGRANKCNNKYKTNKHNAQTKTITAIELAKKLGSSWQTYWNNKYQYFIKYKANRLANNNTLLRDSLMVDGLMGLLTTHKNFKHDRGASFSTLLWKNSYYSMLKSLQSHNKQAPQVSNLHYYCHNYYQDAQTEQLYKQLHFMINNLSPSLQEVFRMKFYQNISTTQIAKQLNKTTGQIRYQIKKAIQELQLCCYRHLPSLQHSVIEIT